jgi:hypothetical protein
MSGIGPTDFVAIFSTIFGDVTSVRAARGLPPLISAHLGQEQLQTEESPPRIVVVPTHNVYEPMRRVGAQPMTGRPEAINPRPFTEGRAALKRTSGATRLRLRTARSSNRTSGTRSTRHSNLSASSSARSCATPATIRTSRSSARSGVSLPIRIGSGVCLCSTSPSTPRSLTSRGWSLPRAQASMSNWSLWTAATAAVRGLSMCHREAA